MHAVSSPLLCKKKVVLFHHVLLDVDVEIENHDVEVVMVEVVANQHGSSLCWHINYLRHNHKCSHHDAAHCVGCGSGSCECPGS